MQHVLMYNTSYKELSIHSGGFAPAMLRPWVYNLQVRRATGSQAWLALGVWYSTKFLRRRLLYRLDDTCTLAAHAGSNALPVIRSSQLWRSSRLSAWNHRH